MICAQVAPGLWVGDENAYHLRAAREPGWSVVHACKDPFHRDLVGYRSRAAPKGSEYLAAVRGDRLALNMIDADDPAYVPDELIGTFVTWAESRWRVDGKLLVHCNQGQSRSPSLGLLLLARAGRLPTGSFAEAESAFRAVYPLYAPRSGIRGFLATRWDALAVRRPAAPEVP